MAQKRFINPEGLVRPGVYTPVVVAQAGRTIYLSGQVPQNEKGELVGRGDLLAQAEQVYRNIALALTGAGATFNDVVKLNVYVVNYKPEYRDLLHQIRQSYVSKENPPASTLIGVQALAREGFLIEIEAIAVAD
ncbi:MAG: RidA family protein [Betaproteobacteria bacterium]|nr:RidA family protein [Betaproteobacteria bacterium]